MKKILTSVIFSVVVLVGLISFIGNDVNLADVPRGGFILFK